MIDKEIYSLISYLTTRRPSQEDNFVRGIKIEENITLLQPENIISEKGHREEV